MQDILLFLHSLLRWVLLLSILAAIINAIRNLAGSGLFTQVDDKLRKTTMIMAHAQLLIGLWLYFISPEVNALFNNFGEAVKVRNVRFFAMEHSLAMIISIVLITIGAIRTKRIKSDKAKLRSQLIWFAIALLIIFMMIPWSFLSFSVHRPFFRGF
jgi:hypothetical protein